MTGHRLAISISLAALVGLAIGSFPRHAAARSNPHLRRGIALLDRAEDERALVELRRALRWRGNRRKDRVLIRLYLGITQLNLLNEAAATKQFETALKLDRHAELPAGVSPKITRFFEQIRERMPPPQKRVRVRTRKPKRVRAQRGARPRPGAGRARRAPPPSIPTIGERPQSRSRGVYWPGWTTLGVAVAAGGTGLALGILGRQRADEANDLSLPHETAVAKHDTAKKMALSANILFAAAGAAAIASGILFYWGSQQGTDQASAGASLVPLPSGALIQLQADLP